MAIQTHAGQSKLAIEYIATDELKPDPENARRHTPAQLKQIAASIKAFGYGAPILVDADNKVLAGHGRLESLKRLGWSEAPVIRMEHLSPAQARAFAITDNRLSDNSSFDERLLALHFKELATIIDLDFSLEDTGFSMGEIDLLIEGLDDQQKDAADPDDEPVLPGPAVSRPGDLWRLGPHRLICGSALDGEVFKQLLQGEVVAGGFHDFPYNVPVNGHISGKGKRKHREFLAGSGEMSGPEYSIFQTNACRQIADHSADGAVHFFTMDWAHIRSLLAAGGAVFDDLLNICVWVKNNGGMGGLYRSAHELVAVFRHGPGRHRNNVQLGKYGRNRENVWRYAGANTFLRSSEEADLIGQHPTPKPVALVADALLDVTARGELVLDAFMGSGSTLMACERIGRRCRGIELDGLYVDLTIRRWQRMSGEAAIRESDGRTFDDLASEAAP